VYVSQVGEQFNCQLTGNSEHTTYNRQRTKH